MCGKDMNKEETGNHSETICKCQALHGNRGDRHTQECENQGKGNKWVIYPRFD